MLEDHLYLVTQAVDRIKRSLPAHIDEDDLFSVGVIGLRAAVERYKPDEGCTFPSYAGIRIRGAILDELRRMDTLPRRARAIARRIRTAEGLLEQRYQRAVTPDEIAGELGISAAKLSALTVQSRPQVFHSLDAEGALDVGIADESVGQARESIEKREAIAAMFREIETLPEIQRKVISMYYLEEMRMAEIAAAFDLSESRISQIVHEILGTLRARMAPFHEQRKTKAVGAVLPEPGNREGGERHEALAVDGVRRGDGASGGSGGLPLDRLGGGGMDSPGDGGSSDLHVLGSTPDTGAAGAAIAPPLSREARWWADFQTVCRELERWKAETLACRREIARLHRQLSPLPGQQITNPQAA